MSVIPTVIRATYRGDYRIELVFQDGVQATVDFSQWLDGPVFEPLRDREFKARLINRGFVWKKKNTGAQWFGVGLATEMFDGDQVTA